MNTKLLHNYVDQNIDLLVEAWAYMYNMIEMNRAGLHAWTERLWLNPNMKDMSYSSSEIKEYIADMDMVEIENLIKYQKGL